MGLETFLGLTLMGAMTGVNAAITSSQNDKNYARQKQLMKYQDELNANRWNEQFSQLNEYNSPKSELGRLESAGINPLFDSNYSGNSVASIGDHTGLGSYSPALPNLDFASGLRDIVQGFFTKESLALEERKVKATEKKTDTDIVNETNMTNSEIQVNIQKIKNMVSEQNKTNTEIDKLKTDMVAVKQQIKQNWESLRLRGETVAQDWAKFGLDKVRVGIENYTAAQNAKIGMYDASTRRKHFQLAEQEFSFQKDKFNKEFGFNVQKLTADIRNNKIDSFEKLLDNTSTSILGFKFLSPKKIADANALLTSFVNSMDDMSEGDFLRIAPKCVDLMDYLGQVAPHPAFPQFGGKSKDKVRNPYLPKDSTSGW